MQTTIETQFLAPATTNTATTREISKARLWIGRVLTGLPGAFIAADGVVKFLNIPDVIEASAKVGYQRSTLPLLGAVEVVSMILLTMRRTQPLGAVLISAYLGGAVATHVRLGDPVSFVLMPVVFAALIWGGLYLRNDRIRALSPFSDPSK
jgi:hypothetical protein